MFGSTSANHGIRVLIVDDHPTIRFGLATFIARRNDMQVCGEAGDLNEAWNLIEAHDPDVAVVDLSLSDGSGLDLIKRIKAERPRTRTIVWSMFDSSSYVERALRAGAQGFIPKREPTERLLEAIRQVHAGGTYPTELAALQTTKRYKAKKSPAASDSFIDELSDRELQVFQMLGEGFDMTRISQRMALSIKTIETYRARIKQKLNCPSRTELVRTAVEWVLRADLPPTSGAPPQPPKT